MIDLSQFVGKNVRVIHRSGKVVEGRIAEIHPITKPYHLYDSVCDTPYTKNGRYFADVPEDTVYDIIHIEEIKTMKKYEQLESKVAEMQKEIERLKREEENYPKLKRVKIIRTVTYTPEEYFEYCEENEIEPSEEGYVEYYMDANSLQDCFRCREHHTQEIKEVDN